MSLATSTSRPAQILLVEDNPDHAFLTRESFELERLRVDLHHVDDGEKCMAFLRREPPYQQAPQVDLILLDLHMPRMDGFEVMDAITRDDKLRHLPVIILTTSYERADVERMYKLRCNSFITKPVDFGGFSKAVRELAGYWLQVVVLPTENAPA
ncbi:MAG TPA: response regulator [Ramlibacter sp.]|nr:response regulator [Ramlibacter sp.]